MRVVFILFVTAAGMLASFTDSLYGALLYAFWSLTHPMDLVFWSRAFSGLYLSFGVAATVIVTSLAQGRRIFVWTPTTMLAIAFFGICFLSLAFRGGVSDGSWNSLWLLTRILVMTFVVSGLLTDIPRIKTYLFCITVCTAALGAAYGYKALLAGSTYIIGPGLNCGEQTGDNNGYAAWLVSALPLIFYMAAIFKKRVYRYIANFFFLGNVIAIALTFSRGGYIALVVMSVVFIISLRRNLTILFMFFFMVGIVFLMPTQDNMVPGAAGGSQILRDSDSAVSGTIDRYAERIKTIQNYEEEGSAQSRLHFWRTAVRMANDNPVFGVGFMRYSDAYEIYDDSGGAFEKRRSVHSVLFEVLADTGYIGFMIFIGLIVSASVMAQRFILWCKRNNVPDCVSLITCGRMVQASLLAFVVSGIFVNTIFFDVFWCVISVAIAMGHIASGAYQPSVPKTMIERQICKLI